MKQVKDYISQLAEKFIISYINPLDSAPPSTPPYGGLDGTTGYIRPIFSRKRRN